MMYDDAFSIQLVEDDHVIDVNFVAGEVPLLLKIGHDLSNGKFGNFDPRSVAKMEMVQNISKNVHNILFKFCFRR